MARPIKTGLDYFPLDTGFLADRKIQRLSRKYGCNGITVYLALLCELYGTNGYYLIYSDDLCFDLSFTLGLEESEVKAVVSYCVEIRLFDEELFHTRGVLTSLGIQNRFREISKRTSVVMAPDLLVTAPKPGIFVAETGVCVTETPVIAAETPPNKNRNKNKNLLSANVELSYGTEPSSDREAALRRARLLEMAADATKGC